MAEPEEILPRGSSKTSPCCRDHDREGPDGRSRQPRATPQAGFPPPDLPYVYTWLETWPHSTICGRFNRASDCPRGAGEALLHFAASGIIQEICNKQYRNIIISKK